MMNDKEKLSAEETMEKVREIKKQCPYGTLPFELPIGLMRNICELCESQAKEIERLRVENKKMREALEEIARPERQNNSTVRLQYFAQQALTPPTND